MMNAGRKNPRVPMSLRACATRVLLASVLCLDTGLACYQYPSVVGSLGVIELSQLEGAVGLLLIAHTVFRLGSWRLAAAILGCWIALFGLLDAMAQPREAEIRRAADQTVASLLSATPATIDVQVKGATNRNLAAAHCRSELQDIMPFMMRMDYQLQCDDGRGTITLFLERGQVRVAWIH
jgi:hypothetical protein